jgi:hypothetical protein
MAEDWHSLSSEMALCHCTPESQALIAAVHMMTSTATPSPRALDQHDRAKSQRCALSQALTMALQEMVST